MMRAPLFMFTASLPLPTVVVAPARVPVRTVAVSPSEAFTVVVSLTTMPPAAPTRLPYSTSESLAVSVPWW